MENLLRRLRQDYPGFRFTQGRSHCWSPKNNHISYSIRDGEAGLLHELGHAQLHHQQYATDLELLHKEVEAWQQAFRLAKTYGIKIEAEHAEDCLDTYRDWVYKRSRCPHCAASGVQRSPHGYQCLNCLHAWQVTAARFCRPYRLSVKRSRGLIVTPAS